jgi:hypothetical protein
MIALLFTVLLIIAAISDVWIHRTTSHRCVKIIKTARAIWRSWPGVLWIGIVIPWLCIIIPTMLFAAAVEWVTDNICSPAMAAVETFKHWLHGFDYYEARRRRNVERRRANIERIAQEHRDRWLNPRVVETHYGFDDVVADADHAAQQTDHNALAARADSDWALAQENYSTAKQAITQLAAINGYVGVTSPDSGYHSDPKCGLSAGHDGPCIRPDEVPAPMDGDATDA